MLDQVFHILGIVYYTVALASLVFEKLEARGEKERDQA